jgi:peptidoglycan/xylan/chitin deacetylase (PgdA/CDA1 family)
MVRVGDSVSATWPENKTAAISLTFDGGLPEHYELVAPILEEHGVQGTFFVTVPALLENPEAWRKLVAQGHEVGSHSLLGISERGHLPAWTLEMVRDDIAATDKGIVEILGQPVTSFAMPGELTEAADGDYKPLLIRQFSYLRKSGQEMNPVEEVDLTEINSLAWAELVGPIESLIPHDRHWSVPVFEGFFSLENAAAEDDLRVLLGHIQHRSNVWAAPFGIVGAAVSSSRKLSTG